MAIQKPDWFRMDAAKFLCDVVVDAMSTLELGACLRLLCRQWIDGYIPDDLKMLARLCRLDDVEMERAWVTLNRFFPEVEPGKRANRYMWIMRTKIIAELERKSDEGTRAARKRWDEIKRQRDALPNGLPIAPCTGPGIGEPIQEQTRTEHIGREQNRNTAVEERSRIHLHAADAVLTLPLKEGAEYPIYQTALEEWARLYPAISLEQQLRNMRGWLIANKTKRKAANGILRFITNWFIKAQNDALKEKPNGRANRSGKSGAFHGGREKGSYDHNADAVIHTDELHEV